MAVIGQYKGVDIQDGTDKVVQQQVQNVNQSMGTSGQALSQSNGSIVADKISNVPNLNVPQIGIPTPTVAGAGVSAYTEANKEIQDQLAGKEKTLTETTTEQKTSVKDLISKLLTKSTEQGALENQAGIPEKTQLLNDITNEYNTKQLQFRREQEAILNTPGITKEQANAQVSEISRRNNQELADIAIRQSVANNNLTSAQNLVNKKVDIMFGDLKDVINYETKFLEDNQDLLSDAEKTQLQLKIDENKNLFSAARDDEQLKSKAIADVLSSGNTIPDRVLQQLLSGKGSDAYTILAQNGISTKAVPSGSDLGTVDSWVDLVSRGLATLTNVPSAIRSSVAERLVSTGANITDPKAKTTIASLESAKSILSSLRNQFDVLKPKFAENFAQRATKGTALRLSALSQSNTDAAAFQSFKEGILATLARAQGEKGTLTDPDVQRARENLPELTDTKDVAERKLDNLESLFTEIQDRTIQVYQQGTNPLEKVSEQDNDPLGLR